MMMCIRAEMGKDNVLLQGPVEADKTYIGGSSRKDYDKAEGEPRPRGQGTAKDAVIGAVACGGKVVPELVSDIASETITEFIKRVVNTEESKLYTDQFRGYNAIGKESVNISSIVFSSKGKVRCGFRLRKNKKSRVEATPTQTSVKHSA